MRKNSTAIDLEGLPGIENLAPRSPAVRGQRPLRGALWGSLAKKKARQDSAGLYSQMRQKPVQDGRFIWQLVGVLAT